MMEKRKHRRFEHKQPVVLQILDEMLHPKESYPCHVKDVSAQGARIEAHADVPVGQRVKIRITLETSSGVWTISPHGKVKWVRKAADNGPSQMGIELSATPSSDFQKWSDYVKKKRSFIF
jgi:hypothetical protein